MPFPTRIDLTNLTAAQGFIIQGDAADDETGFSVSNAGDVNGDGIDDLIVGAPLGDDGGAGAGEAYVVFGTRDGFGGTVGVRHVIDLTSLAAGQGFVVQGDASGDTAGRSVSAAGDVNGDGIDDLIVGARNGDDGGAQAGEAYVVFGTRAGFGSDVGGRQVIDLTSLTAGQGFIVQGDAADDMAGISVSDAGDVNGDGIDDVIVGAFFGNDGGPEAGEAYVVFGTRAGFGVDVGGRQVIDLTSLTASQGFIVQGDVGNDRAGYSVSAAGDINGDGIDDIIVGAIGGDDGGDFAGEAYVVFGTRAGFGADVGGRRVIDLTSLTASKGFIIQGDSAQDQLGIGVSAAGDVNGDGIADMIVGANVGDDGGTDAGEAYVVFGTRSGFGTDVSGRRVVDLTGLTASQGFVVQGDAAGDLAGGRVSAAGDVNGDGIDDIIVGATGGDDGGNFAGEAYVIYGTRGGFGSDVGGRRVIDLTSLGPQGFVIQGDAAGDEAGVGVSAAGDVDGDGIDDLIVGARNGDDGGNDAGEAYVIFGQATTYDPAFPLVIDVTDFTPDDGFIVQGAAAGDRAGWSVSDAGDVNGDGIDDFIVGARYGDGGGSDAGAAYVVFGSLTGFGSEVGGRQVLDLAGLTPGEGFIIQGDAPFDAAGISVSSAGDVNGDGIDDLIVGAYRNAYGGADAGQAYVVFGSRAGFGSTVGGHQLLDVANLASDQGFIIQSDAAGDRTGQSVSGAGDVNGDGIDDLIVGAPRGDDGGTDAGEAYVLFGTRGVFGNDVFGRQFVDLASLGSSQGFVIQGDMDQDRAGWSVSAAGDVNGDGIDDVIVGAPYGDDGGNRSGEAYVVFGTRAGFGSDVGGRQVIDLTSLTPAQGFILQGDTAGEEAGWSVSDAGDVNGDGIDDLIVGAPVAAGGGGGFSGRAYVVFGSLAGFGSDVGGRQVVDFTTLTSSQGFFIQGDSPNDSAGYSVSRAGDINGDGIDDLLVGARFDNLDGQLGQIDAGVAYVIFGSDNGFGTQSAGRSTVNVGSLTAAQGFKIQGDAKYDFAGQSVSAAGDINGDGLDDLILGAVGGDDAGDFAGEAYVIYGRRVEQNSAPIATDNDGATVAEGASVTISTASLNFTDTQQDASEVTYTLTSLPANGSVRLTGIALGLGGSFTQSDIDNGRVSYLHNGSETTSDAFGFSVSDGVGGTTTGQTYNFNITAANDTPVFTGLDGTSSFTEGGAAVQLDADVTLVDTELALSGNYNGATLTVERSGGADTADSWSFTGGGPVSFVGAASNGALLSTADGTLSNIASATRHNGRLVVQFNASAVQADINAVLQNLLYANSSDAPPGSVVLGYSFSDGGASGLGGAMTGTGSVTVSITPTDDPATARDDQFYTDELTAETGDLRADNGDGADSDPDGGSGFVITEVNGSAANVGTQITLASGALLTVNANGTFSYDPNGAYQYVPDSGSGGSNLIETDSFTYTVTGGDIATVRIDITGVDNDDLVRGSSANDILDGGTGTNTLSYDNAAGGVTVALGVAEPQDTGDAGTDTISNFTNLSGSDFPDVLRGNAAGNILNGLGGVDVLVGGAGDDAYYVDEAEDRVHEGAGGGTDTVLSTVSYVLPDREVEKLTLIGVGELTGSGNRFDNEIFGNGQYNVLAGYGGNDRLDGQGGPDQMKGGAGDDTYVVSDATDKLVEKDGEGTDTVRTSVNFTLPGNAIENIVITGTDAVNVTGNAEDNVISGNAAANAINGAGGSDRIDGGEGADLMAGGLGDDTFVVDNAGDRIKEKVGQGTDTVESAISFSLQGLEVENLTLTGSIAVAATGNGHANVLTGNGSDNVLLGYAGNDTLVGGNGADALRGMDGDDAMTGGEGADRFYFDGGFEDDAITDFEIGVDQIWLRHTVFQGIGTGPLSADAFVSASAAQNASDRIIYDADTGALYFDPDGTGAAAAVQFATLATGLDLSSADFVLF